MMSTQIGQLAIFSDPISDLLLYPVGWRGIAAGGPNPVTYEFDQPFTDLSGLGGGAQRL
ncbi:MAG: hypothetical protein AAGG02_11565 [Cyanobacteria bacterium P01_H01_bin.15]